MSRLINRVAKLWGFTNHIHSVGIILASISLTLMTLVVCYEVVLRYVFNNPTTWGLDMAEFGMVACGFLGASYVLARGRHVRVELLISRLRPKPRLVLEFLSSIIMLIYFMVLLWQGWAMTWRSYTLNWYTPDLAEIPIWPAQSIIPFSAFLLCLAVIDQIVSYIRAWRAESK